jgi:hypothetical protein
MLNPRINRNWKALLSISAAMLLFAAVQPAMAAYFVTPSTYWQLEDADPLNNGVTDDMGNANGTCTTCPGAATGLINQAFDFSGGEFQIEFADNAVFDFAAGASFSIELWMRRDGVPGSTEVLIGRDDTVNSVQWYLAVTTTGTVSTYFVDGNGGPEPATTLKGYSNVADDAWHHVVVVRNGGTTDNLQLYVDGVLEGVQDHSGTLTSTDDSFDASSVVTLGNLPGSSVFWYGGLLDNVAIYSANALSAAVVAQNYLNGLGRHDLDEEFSAAFSGDATDTIAIGYSATLQARAAGNPMPTYSSASLPAGASIDTAGIITWQPSDIQIGANSFTVSASNGQSANQNWTVTVADLCAATIDAHWKLEEDGGPYVDQMGVVGDAAIGEAAPARVAGNIGYGQSFAGGNAEIVIPSNAVFDWAAGASFSIELWMQRDGAPSSREVLMARNDDVGSTQWWLAVNTDGTAGAYFRDADGGPEPDVTLRGYSNVADNNWHHIVVVRDGIEDNLQIYVDGVLERVQDHSGTLTSTDGAFTISGTSADVSLGRLPNSTYWYGGLLDEVALYNTALPAAIIAQHAHPGTAQSYCNGAPVIDSTEITDATEDIQYSYTATATDPEGHDITWSLTTAPSGMAIDSSSGQITWTPDDGVVTADVVVLATDQFGATDTQTFTITVTPVNDAPQITGQQSLSTPEDTALTIALSDLTVVDPDNTYPTGFTLIVQDGANYTHNGADITPAADFNGTLTVPVRVNDGQLDSNVYNLQVTVTAVANPAPAGGGGGGGGGCFITSLN